MLSAARFAGEQAAALGILDVVVPDADGLRLPRRGSAPMCWPAPRRCGGDENPDQNTADAAR